MSEIENGVTSFEISRKLKELNILQESYFCWVITAHVQRLQSSKTAHGYCKHLQSKGYECELISAYTVDELGGLLPDYYVSFRNEYGQYAALPYKECNRRKTLIKWSDTEANARAELLIHLIENNLTKLKSYAN